jgi:hypothetical protein
MNDRRKIIFSNKPAESAVHSSLEQLIAVRRRVVLALAVD